MRQPPPPPPDRAERVRWPEEPYVRYPDYYQTYYHNTYDSGYRRPYEDNYRDYQSQPYPYRPNYEDYPTRYHQEDRYSSRYYPHRAPPYPPRPRYEDEDRHMYRRESFSEYRDQPSKRRRARPDDSTNRSDRSPSPEKPRRRHNKPKVIREEYESDSEHSTDYGASSDAESVQSVREITERTRMLSTRHHSDHDEEEEMTYKEWTDQEKGDYYDRIELVTALLENELDMPKTKKQPTTSGGRDPVIIKTKPELLPPAPFVTLKFNDHLERAEAMIEKVDIIKKKKQDNPQNENPDQTQVESPKVKLGLAMRPFNPSWLYKLTEKEPWPNRVKPDHSIKQLTVNKEAPTEEYVISRAHVHKVQFTCSLQMNAASHIDWYIIAMKKILTELQDACDDSDPRLKALQDLRHGIAYANEYMVDQAVFNHAGMTNLMREHYLGQMEGIENEDYNELITQPYNSKSAFNGEADQMVKEQESRDRSAAFKKLARDRSPDKPKSSKKKNSDTVQRIYDLKYRLSASKVKKRTNYGNYDSKGKRKSRTSRSDGQWQPKPKSNTSSFPFSSKKFQKKKSKKGNYQSKSGGRGRDHN